MKNKAFVGVLGFRFGVRWFGHGNLEHPHASKSLSINFYWISLDNLKLKSREDVPDFLDEGKLNVLNILWKR